MIKRRYRPTAPGEILKAHYLEPRGVSITEFAETVGCSRKHMSNVVHGKARIEPELATRIAKALQTTARFWLNLQSAVDAYDAEQALMHWRPRKTYTTPKVA